MLPRRCRSQANGYTTFPVASEMLCLEGHVRVWEIPGDERKRKVIVERVRTDFV